MSSILTADLQGGLGNQLFLIATGYAVAKKLGLRFCLVRNKFGGKGQGSHPSKYYDTLYRNIEFVDTLVDAQHVQQKGWGYYALVDEVAAVRALHPTSDITIGGYFQCPTFFSDVFDELRNMLTPPEGIIPYLEQSSPVFQTHPELRSAESFAFIGIRRGDYLKATHVHLPCGMTYYNEAIRRLKADGCSKFYIASDDMAWVRANFKGDEFCFLDITDDLELFYIMALFPQYIISNSTYHWWGSFMSIYPGARCIAPSQWVNIPGAEEIYRAGMEIVDRPVET
jgi:hypothetical protein